MIDTQLDRVIGTIEGAYPGPTLVFFGGIHGNEHSGVQALQQVINELHDPKFEVFGKIYALSGNIEALERNVRFVDTDLNRLWTRDRVEQLTEGFFPDDRLETLQQFELLQTLIEIMDSEQGPFYFFDLHTTSGDTIPFMTVNDSLLNRKFTQQYPVPLVLGIEEYLEGPLLSYINELGYVSFGFEGGQHTDPHSVENHRSFIYLTLYFTGALRSNTQLKHWHYEMLRKSCARIIGFYEIFFRLEVKHNDHFQMKPGFENFEKITKGQVLADYNGKLIKATKRGRMFMPRYQPLGDDGFFGIKRIPPFFLWLSEKFRKSGLGALLVALPGIQFIPGKDEKLIIDKRIARLFPKSFLHLLGYRSKRLDANRWVMKNREVHSRTEEYKEEHWMR